PGSVVGEARVNLGGDPAVDPAGLLVDTSQNVAGILHVLDSHGEDRLAGGHAGGSQRVQLLVVGSPLGHGGREGGRVGAHSPDALGIDEGGELTAGQAWPGQVIEPHGGASGSEFLDIARSVHRSPAYCWQATVSTLLPRAENPPKNAGGARRNELARRARGRRRRQPLP